MRRRQSRATSTLLNLAGIALVLPGCGLALYFVAVDHLARHTLGEWADSLWAALDWLPSPELMPFGIIAVLLAAGVLLCAMVWLPWLTPCLVCYRPGLPAWRISFGPSGSPISRRTRCSGSA